MGQVGFVYWNTVPWVECDGLMIWYDLGYVELLLTKVQDITDTFNDTEKVRTNYFWKG